MNKRGISAIVATVLIILITVAAVTIIWIAIIPMIQNNLNIVDANARIEVVTTGGYTFYDESTGTSYVQIRRGTDEEEIVKIEIIYIINGTSETYVIDDSTYFPEPNGMKTIILPISEKPDSVRIVAYYFKSGKIKAGIPSSAKIGESTAAEPIEEGGYTPATDLEGKTIVNAKGNALLIRFLQVTDTHIIIGGSPTPSSTDGRTDNCFSKYLKDFNGTLGKPNYYSKYCNTNLYNSTGGSIAPTIAWINATNAMNKIPRVDFSVHTGDLTAQTGFDSNKTASIDKFEEIASTLNHDYYIVTSIIHDGTFDSKNSDYFESKVGDLNWSFIKENNLFLGISRGTPYNEDWINNILNDNSDKGMNLFVFIHYIPKLLDSNVIDILENYNDNYNEIILIDGHWHINDYKYSNQIHFITTTAIMNYPTEFRIFDIYADRVEIYMSNITSPEINNVSETLVDWYIYNQENGLSPGLARADPDGTKIGLAGDEFERTITISLD